MVLLSVCPLLLALKTVCNNTYYGFNCVLQKDVEVLALSISEQTHLERWSL